MLFEMRTHTIRTGRLGPYVDDFEHRGLPVITRRRLIACWISEVGALNEVVHRWGYDKLTDAPRNAPCSVPTRTGPTGTCPRRWTTSSIKNRGR
jgi:hypothetical protein